MHTKNILTMAPLNTGEQLWKNLQNLLAGPSNEDPSGIFTADELIRLRMVYQGQTYEQTHFTDAGRTERFGK